MSSVNSNLHNLRSVLIGPTSRFIFANGALTRAQAQAMGAEDFGNLKAHQLQVENTTEPVLTSVDGITQQIDEQSRLLAIGYQLTSRASGAGSNLRAARPGGHRLYPSVGLDGRWHRPGLRDYGREDQRVV